RLLMEFHCQIRTFKMRLIPCTELREHSLWLDRRGQKGLLCELNQKGYTFPVTTGSAHTGLLGLLVCETCMLMCVCVYVCVCVCVCVSMCVGVCVERGERSVST